MMMQSCKINKCQPFWLTRAIAMLQCFNASMQHIGFFFVFAMAQDPWTGATWCNMVQHGATGGLAFHEALDLCEKWIERV